MDREVIREAYRLRNAYARSFAETPHFRVPVVHGGGGSQSWGLTLSEAIEQAKALVRAPEEGLTCEHESEIEPWDGDSPAPKHLFCLIVRDAAGVVRASLGMVGVNDLRDPYLLTCEAELYAEVLAEIDEERDRASSDAAEALAARATFAGPSS